MHEWSIAKTLREQAVCIGREQGAKRLLEVRIEIGPLTGIEARLLESAFERLTLELDPLPIRLVVDAAPLVVHCQRCERESEIPDFDFYCRLCLGRGVRVVRGDELQLVSVTVDEPISTRCSSDGMCGR